MSTYVLIEKYTVGAGGVSSVTLGSGGTIPQTYTDLVIKFSLRSSNTSAEGVYISFNGSTTSFTDKYLEGSGSGASSGSLARYVGCENYSTTTSNTFNNGEIYIPNYTSSNYKSFSVDNVEENNATAAFATFNAGLWSNTAAITSITFTVGSTRTMVQYTNFYLYGILKA